MASIIYLILKSARRARLEGHTTSVQFSQRSSFGFLHTLFRRDDNEMVRRGISPDRDVL